MWWVDLMWRWVKRNGASYNSWRGKAKSFGIEAHLLSPQETKGKLPLLNDKAIRGSIYVPSSALAGGRISGQCFAA